MGFSFRKFDELLTLTMDMIEVDKASFKYVRGICSVKGINSATW